jgi:putative thioredoxin
MASDFIINVDEASFEFEVVAYSSNLPVVVDFWATWCKPCQVLGPMLEHLAIEAAGSFRLARVDVDSNPNLALRFGVRTIPTVKAFSSGNIVAEFVGAQPESRIRDFLGKITPPSPTNLAIEKANSLLSLQLWLDAEKIFRSVLDQNPGQPASLLGLAKSLLAQGKSSEAVEILEDFPASRQYSSAETLLPLGRAMQALYNNIMPRNGDLDSTFHNCIRLVGRGNLVAALDGLFEILRQNKRYRDGSVRLTALGILELMGEDDPMTRQYRSELASILF